MYPDYPDSVEIMKRFLTKYATPSPTYRNVLRDKYDIPEQLVAKLYDTHTKCRLQMARIELSVYYRLFNHLKGVYIENNLNWSGWGVDDKHVVSLSHYIHHINTLEQLLQVSRPRAERLRQKLRRTKEKVRRQAEERNKNKR